MKGWYYFWTITFILSGFTFFVITLVVLVRGLGDLREMFRRLKATGRDRTPSDGTNVE